VWAEPFYLKVKGTHLYSYKIFVNDALAAEGAPENENQETPIGSLLIPGTNRVRVCFTPQSTTQLPKAKEIAKVTIQSNSQRDIASVRTVASDQKFALYVLAPYGQEFIPNAEACKTLNVNVNAVQLTEFQYGKSEGNPAQEPTTFSEPSPEENRQPASPPTQEVEPLPPPDNNDLPPSQQAQQLDGELPPEPPGPPPGPPPSQM
tara:strand:+ start:133788 stop:134402 length:615 start_codon:yes stop_codon:yes gene_type:complete